MGRPKGGRNITHSKEEKLKLVKRTLNGESGVQLQKETGIYAVDVKTWESI